MGVIDGHDMRALRRTLREALKAGRSSSTFTPSRARDSRPPEWGLEGMEKWHAAKPGSIVDRQPAPKKPVPVKESDAPT